MSRRPDYPLTYLIRSGVPWHGAAETYEVGKLENGSLVGVYRVWRAEDGSLQCDCPSGIHHPSDSVVCKHRRWVAAGAGEPPWTVEVASARDEGRFVDLGLGVHVLEEAVAARTAERIR